MRPLIDLKTTLLLNAVCKDDIVGKLSFSSFGWKLWSNQAPQIWKINA